MALNFPDSPTDGQVFGAWRWNAGKPAWVAITSVAGGGSPGDITAVFAGSGLSGGGIDGDVILSLQSPVTVAHGGTGAVDAANALTNLGAAPIASPTFTGDPKAPTPATADNDTSVATTAYVKAQGYLTSPINLTSQVTGVLPIANGGTGSSTAAAAPWVEVAGDTMTGALTTAAAGIIMPNGAYLWGKDTGGTNRTIAGAYTDNVAYFGDAAINTTIRGAATVSMNAATGGKLSLQVGSEELVVINTGGLAIQKAPGHPSLVLHKFTANGYYNKVAGYSQGATRWELNIGDGANETGSNVGSEFTLARFSDAGGYTGTALMVKRNDGSCWNGTGTWSSFSDIAVKHTDSIQPYTRGLADIVQLEPVFFKYNGKGDMPDDGTQHFGLVAQQVQPFVPEVVTSRTWEPKDDRGEQTGDPSEELLGLDPGRLIYALINAVKELKAEIDALKNPPSGVPLC